MDWIKSRPSIDYFNRRTELRSSEFRQTFDMKKYRKRDFPVAKIRRFLEPGPIVLVSSAWKGKTNIMTMGWHMVMEMEPSLVGCFIWDRNHSFDMMRRSKECVINIPTADLAAKVVSIGN